MRNKTIKAFGDGTFTLNKEQGKKDEKETEKQTEEQSEECEEKQAKKKEKQVNKREKTSPDWFMVKDSVFKRIFNTVSESVENKLSTKVEKKPLTKIPSQHFLQDIVNKKFNTIEDAKKWYIENLLKNFEIKLRGI